MRRRLNLTVLAVTAMVAVAFLVPLAAAVKVVARERALAVASQEAQSLAGVLAAEPSVPEIRTFIAELDAAGPRRAVVFLPGGQQVGDAPALPPGQLQQALAGNAFTSSSGGDRWVWVAVRLPGGQVSAAVVYVPAVLLESGVTTAWLLLLVVGILIVAAAVFLADRLGRSLVRPMSSLMEVTRRLQEGDLDARIEPSGPEETAAVGSAINDLAVRMKHLLALEREAAADLSHSLRTPLAALSLEADSMSSESDRRRMVEAVSKVTEAVDTVIVKVREGRRPDDAACDDLPAVIRGRLAFWDLLAREQDRVWIADLPDQPVAVEMSRPQAVELLDTLLGNIFAHTDPGTGFRVKVTTEGDFALLSVEDDGPGFPADPVVERGASGAGSTGLGLDIVRRAAEAAGGQMTIASRAAGGALVRVSLRRSVAAGPARFSDSLARPEAVAPMMDR